MTVESQLQSLISFFLRLSYLCIVLCSRVLSLTSAQIFFLSWIVQTGLQFPEAEEPLHFSHCIVSCHCFILILHHHMVFHLLNTLISSHHKVYLPLNTLLPSHRKHSHHCFKISREIHFGNFNYFIHFLPLNIVPNSSD